MLQKFLQNNFTLIEVLKEKVGDFALLKKIQNWAGRTTKNLRNVL